MHGSAQVLIWQTGDFAWEGGGELHAHSNSYSYIIYVRTYMHVYVRT